MARKPRQVQPLPTIWETPDPLWEQIEPILNELDPPAATGRPRNDPRRSLDGIIYQMRSGVQWNRLPKEFGSDSAVHRAYQRWVALGFFQRVWALLIEACADLGGVDWQWQSADAALGKARLGGIKWAKTPRIAAKTAARRA
jgi:transposase